MMSTRTVNVILGLALCASLSFNVAVLGSPRPSTTTRNHQGPFDQQPTICCLDQHVGFVGGTTAGLP